MLHFKKKIRSYEYKKNYMGYVFILPFLIGICFLFIPNMIKTFLFSVNDIHITGGGYSLKYAGVKYFIQALTANPQFVFYLGDSIRKLLFYLPTILIFSLFIASVLNQKFKGRVIARSIFFIPVILATGVVAFIESSSQFMDIINVSALPPGSVNTGAIQLTQIDTLLKSLNIGVLSDVIKTAANNVYIIVRSSGIQIFILLVALQEIPVSLFEAGKIEGCTGWDFFWKVTIQYISPQLFVCGIYTIIDIFLSPTNMLTKFVNKYAFELNQYAYGTAMYFVYFICIGFILSVLGIITKNMVANRN